tara:strand:- start:1332 stop:1622 length:291 start_codon:yes stop_codon:yes gene_type:complete
MNLGDNIISDLEDLIADKLFLKVENWNLYLGDAGLARILAIKCLANLENKKIDSVKESLNEINVRIGDGTNNIPLIQFMTDNQIKDLEEILETFSY